jgi:Flp pilus assembly pilin Flp
MKPIFRKLARDRRGTSAMEFAFVAPVLALLVIGMTDAARGVAHRYKLDQASYRALELVTSYPTITEADLKTAADVAAGPQADTVTITKWLECDGEVATECDPGNPDATPAVPAEQIARYIMVEIRSDFDPLFNYGPIAAALGANQNGKVPLLTRATLRIQ